MEKKEAIKIQEFLHIFKAQEEDWNQRFKGLQTAGIETVELMKSQLKKWKQTQHLVSTGD